MLALAIIGFLVLLTLGLYFLCGAVVIFCASWIIGRLNGEAWSHIALFLMCGIATLAAAFTSSPFSVSLNIVGTTP